VIYLNRLVSIHARHQRYSMISSSCAMDQLTSSQQALPNCLFSQGLYALLLLRIAVGVRSLSARSFKVRHGMRGDGESSKGKCT
jgi:hypothetical protein